jgi:photosystem II stability/assembly factor-like uncharacterized protein
MCRWLLQPWPVSGDEKDLKFFNQNIGLFSITNSSNNSGVWRTTNGGNNWINVLSNVVYQLQIIDSNIVFGWGMSYNGSYSRDLLYKSFDKGLSWDSTIEITGYSHRYIYFVNKDTGWVSGFNGGNDEIWKTTNGGITFTPYSGNIGWGVVFLLKNKINGEYYGWCSDYGGGMYKTTNTGISWFQVGGAGSLWQLEFINENTGFATTPGGTDMLKTTNGGLNWISYVLPTGNGIVLNQIKNFKLISNNVIYGDYGVRQFPDNGFRGIIWKSTNGGVNWGFQQPDTSYHFGYTGIDFTDSLNGWSYNIHTTNGGGPIIYTDISNNSITLPNTFILKQNYPNPFNPTTTIEFSIPKDSYVKLKIFDITGRTVFVVINNFMLKAGNHKYKIDAFNTLGLSSGVYFYQIEVRDLIFNNKLFSETKKMLYVK